MASTMEELLDGTDKTSYTDLCKICLRNRSLYVCPRCNTPYCSLNCYKSEVHLDCSESFYQEWVESDLKCNRVSSEGQKKMFDILNRMHQEEINENEELDSDDDTSMPDIAERLEGVDLNDANKVWEKLSTSEQAAFRELVTSGEVANIIPPWEPWWTQRYDEPLVVDIDNDSSLSCRDYMQKCPPVHNKITPLAAICRTPPSDTVVFDLINILGGYALTTRYFNGEYSDVPEEAATIIFNISQSLSFPSKFKSSGMALEAVGLRALIYEGIETGEKEIDVMKDDVRCIIKGPTSKDQSYYILAALTDMHNLFSFFKKKKKAKKNGVFSQSFPTLDDHIKIIDKKSCQTCLRRIEFMQSWTVANDLSKVTV